VLYLKKDIIDKLTEWTLVEKPNEAAGYLFKDNSIFRRIITSDKSITHFYDENPEQLLKWIEKYGSPNIFHSHPCAGIPSGTDILYMKNTLIFNSIWFIMGNKMDLRAWKLDSNYRPIELEVNIID